MTSASSPITDLWGYLPEDLRVRYDEICVSIPHALQLAAARAPQTEAVVDGDQRLTFAELEAAMVEAVRAVVARGVRPGDRVALWAPNSLRWMVAALGALGAGAVLVPVNTRFKGEEAAYVLERSGASLLVTVTDFLGLDYVAMLRAATPASALVGEGRLVALSGDGVHGVEPWEEFLAAGAAVTEDEARSRIAAVRADDLCDIMFTSGTTGHPKGVMLTHGQSLRAHGWLSKVLDFRAGDRYLVIPPFFHTFGYKAGWMACLVHGCTTLPLATFSVPEVLRLIEQERVTVLLGPPTLFQGLLDSPERASYDLSSLRVTMASAANVPPDLVRRMRDELGSTTQVSCYGLTEGTSLATTTLPGIDSFEDVTTTVGRAAWGVETLVVDDDGDEVPADASGELLLRGYNVMQGYWQDPERTAEVVTPDGWLRTGDIVVKDARGFIRITDRKKDVVIVGGFNVYPAEVERLLGAHPDVADLAVVGAPDERWGEVPVAFVVPRPGSGLTAEAFIAWAGETIANFKVPRRVELVDDLPRNASMKVLKGELRARARG